MAAVGVKRSQIARPPLRPRATMMSPGFQGLVGAPQDWGSYEISKQGQAAGETRGSARALALDPMRPMGPMGPAPHTTRGAAALTVSICVKEERELFPVTGEMGGPRLRLNALHAAPSACRASDGQRRTRPTHRARRRARTLPAAAAPRPTPSRAVNARTQGLPPLCQAIWRHQNTHPPPTPTCHEPPRRAAHPSATWSIGLPSFLRSMPKRQGPSAMFIRWTSAGARGGGWGGELGNVPRRGAAPPLPPSCRAPSCRRLLHAAQRGTARRGGAGAPSPNVSWRPDMV
jgi:hypothetical protein